QTFNILMGRTLQRHRGLEKQIAIFMPLLEGLDGIEKMSKSLGNYIGVHEAPEVMFKKIMELPDSLIIKYFELATDEHPLQVQAVQERLQNGENPRDIKLQLAEIVTALYHGHAATMDAKSYFEAAFQKKMIPANIPVLLLEIDKERIEDIIPQLISIQFIQSKSDFIRLIKQNGVSLNGEKIAVDDLSQVLMNEDVLQIGKKRFLKLNK
ncbi:MAG TPA: tyrosine--tRNA ligase, partial [Lysinibacillus sp.]|nr:tyrosine--tRNA ligase [Lysinibacillus sp.]